MFLSHVILWLCIYLILLGIVAKNVTIKGKWTKKEVSFYGLKQNYRAELSTDADVVKLRKGLFIYIDTSPTYSLYHDLVCELKTEVKEHKKLDEKMDEILRQLQYLYEQLQTKKSSENVATTASSAPANNAIDPTDASIINETSASPIDASTVNETSASPIDASTVGITSESPTNASTADITSESPTNASIASTMSAPSIPGQNESSLNDGSNFMTWDGEWHTMWLLVGLVAVLVVVVSGYLLYNHHTKVSQC